MLVEEDLEGQQLLFDTSPKLKFVSRYNEVFVLVVLEDHPRVLNGQEVVASLVNLFWHDAHWYTADVYRPIVQLDTRRGRLDHQQTSARLQKMFLVFLYL